MPGSDVENQVDRIRITMQPLTIEEIYRLWTGFQTQYRLSVSYEVSVILIESSRAVSTPLPVLKLGVTRRGATVTPDVFPYPVLFSVQLNNFVPPISPGSFGGLNPANVPPIALPGDKLVIQGHRLSGPRVNVSFASAAATPAVPVVPDANTGDSAQPPLALNLYYMITAYAREKGDTGDIDSHNLLGRVMRVLFDHP